MNLARLLSLATLASAPALAQDPSSVGGPATGVPVSTLAPASGSSHDLFVCTSTGLIYRIDHYQTAPKAVLLGSPGVGGLADMAVDPRTGEFVAMVLGGEFYRIDPFTMDPTHIGTPTFGDANALESSPEGTFYARGYGHTDLWIVDVATARMSSVGDTGSSSAGDLALHVEGELLGTTGDLEMDEIDPTNGAAAILGPLPIAAAFGLEVDVDGTIYVFGLCGGMFTYDYATGTTTQVGSLSVSGCIWGAAFGFPGGGGGPLGTNYCGPASLNSSGQPARIAAFGSPAVTLNDVRLDASQMPPMQLGMFLNGQAQGFSLPPGSQGYLCLGGGIGRYRQHVLSTGTAGAFSLQLDLYDTPTPGGSVAVQAGETWYFQAWFRDHNPGATSNFTDGLAITFE